MGLNKKLINKKLYDNEYLQEQKEIIDTKYQEITY